MTNQNEGAPTTARLGGLAEKFVPQLRFFHFTDVRNLSSIAEHGLLTIDELARVRVKPFKFDQARHDRQFAPEGPICVAIGHPSPSLLRTNGMERQFVVLELDPKFYFDLESLIVCPTNAASDEMSSMLLDVDLNELRVRPKARSVLYNPSSIVGLFFDPYEIKWKSGASGSHDRDKSKASRRYPNDPQAELLISQTISPEHIVKVFCRSDAVAHIIKKSAPEFSTRILINDRFFLPRSDLKYWWEKSVDVGKIVGQLETEWKFPAIARVM
jgi:hypothetical protein